VKNTVFVFGAGASHAVAGLPLGLDLVWKYAFATADFKSPDDGLTCEESQCYQFLRLMGRYFPELEGESARYLREFAEPNYIYYPVDLEKRHHVDELLKSLFKAGDVSGVDSARTLIAEHLVSMYPSYSYVFSTQDAHRADYRPLSLYEKLVKELRDRDDQVSIISFNFDTLLHEDNRKEVFLDYQIKFDCMCEGRKFYVDDWRVYPNVRRIPLIKPHGSLDWRRCTKCRRLNLTWFRHTLERYRKAKCQHCREPIDLHPLIVVPHEDQPEPEVFNPLWEQTEACLQQADELIVIGYSFPDYDTRAHELFAKVNPRAATTIVDFAGPVDAAQRKRYWQRRISKIMPQCTGSLEIYLDGFELWLKDEFDITRGEPKLR